jgi:hypothetical protein
MFYNITNGFETNSLFGEEYVGPLDKAYEEDEESINEELNKHSSIKDYVLVDNDVLVEVKNNNKYGVDADVYIEYLDENNNVIAQSNNSTYIAPKKKSYVKFYTNSIIEEENSNSNYSSYKTKVVFKYAYGINFSNKCIKMIRYKEKEWKLYLKYKNTCNKKIECLSLGVLFYNGDKIIGYDSDFDFDIKKNATKTAKFFIPDNGDDYENINYDRVEFVVEEAYSY